MIPNYKRPSVREYLHDVWETGPTDQDIDMLLYLEECEKRSKILDEVLDHPFFTEECPLSVANDDYDEERFVTEICGCYHSEQDCESYKKCWLNYFKGDVDNG